MCQRCGYRDPWGDPTNSHGHLRDSNRINNERMDSLGLRPLPAGELYSSRSGRFRHSLEDPWEDDPSPTQERFTRGYNPDYNGERGPRSVASAPDYDADRGFRDEPRQNKGMMRERYAEYKHSSELSMRAQATYRRTRRTVPKTDFRHPKPGFYGSERDCITTRSSHESLASLAERSANLALIAARDRERFDRDYVGHYPDRKMRDGHTQFSDQLHRLSVNADRASDYHSRYIDDSDDDSDHSRYIDDSDDDSD